MGCDYYIITYLQVIFGDNATQYIEIRRDNYDFVYSVVDSSEEEENGPPERNRAAKLENTRVVFENGSYTKQVYETRYDWIVQKNADKTEAGPSFEDNTESEINADAIKKILRVQTYSDR